MENRIIIPNSFMGVNGEEALERILQKTPMAVQPSNPIVAPTPASNILQPEKYVILEGRSHGNYSYPDLFMDMERTHNGNDWYKTHDLLTQEGAFMPNIRQFVDFLNLLKSGKAFDGKGKQIDKRKLDSVLDDIVTVRAPWRAEWLDADFKVLDKKLGFLGGNFVMNYDHRFVNGKLTANRKNEVIEGYLAQDKTPGISLDDWLAKANDYGLPKSDVNSGKLYYWRPKGGRVAGFDADSVGALLNCRWDPSDRNSSLGVRAAREKN